MTLTTVQPTMGPIVNGAATLSTMVLPPMSMELPDAQGACPPAAVLKMGQDIAPCFGVGAA